MANLTVPQKCTVENCDKDTHARRYCMKHYTRYRRHGDPLGGHYFGGEGRIRIDSPRFAKRFWSRVAITADDTRCWLWQAGLFSSGYGQIFVDNREQLAHRIAWQLANERVPMLDILHSCDVPACVNPKHLHEGTHKENMQEALQRGRFATKVTENQVREIRALKQEGYLHKDIAILYGINRQNVGMICSRKTWRYIV